MSRKRKLVRQQQQLNEQRKKNIVTAIIALLFCVLVIAAVVARLNSAKQQTTVAAKEVINKNSSREILDGLSPGDIEAVNEQRQMMAAGKFGTIPQTAAKTVQLSPEVAKNIWNTTEADIDRAMSLIENNLGPDRMNMKHPYMQSLSVHSKSWLMLHQIRPFGAKDWQLSFFEQRLGVRDGKPFGSYMLEGHAGEISSTLLRVLPPNYKLKIRGSEFELQELALNKAPQYQLFPEENSFVLDALVSAHNPDSIYWERTETMLANELLVGLQRYTKGKETGTGACGALHFYDALSRFHGSLQPRSEMLKSVNEELGTAVKSTTDEMRRRTQQYINSVEGDYFRFATSPDKTTSRLFSFDYTYIGHSLEIILDPKGVYLKEFTDDELTQMAQITARMINLWFDPRFNPSACGMQQYIHVDNSTIYDIHMGNLLHAYSGLKLFKERKQMR